MINLFKVEGQTLTPIEIYPAVSDTVNYLTFAFMFSYDWAGLTKSAIFTKGTDVHEVVLTDDEVLESDHVNLSAGVWSISVVGDTVVDAVVTRQITTTSYDYTVAQSSATSGGVFPPSIASQVYVNTSQATPQTFVGGIPKLAADRVIENENDMVDAKFVNDSLPVIPAHNGLASIQGGSAEERYHMTQAQNTALHAHSNKTALDAVAGVNTGDQAASSFNHNDLANKQGGTAGEYYHVTAAEKTVIEHTSGTNTGDQDVSGAISTHNTDAGAHADKQTKSITDTGNYFTTDTVEGALQEVGLGLSLVAANRVLYFRKSNYDMYIRTPFNATQDLLQKLITDKNLGVATGSLNPIIGFNQTFLMSKTIPLSDAWTGDLYHDNTDDIAPQYYNSTYIGGNHGAFCCKSVTSAGHDKTTADLGSQWTDSAAKVWTLVRIVDASTLLFCPPITTHASGYWLFSTTLTGATLTHSSGATHTGTVVTSANATAMFMPAVKTVALSILVDGLTVPIDNMVYKASFVDIIQSYDIADPRSTLAYMQANIGKQIYEALASVAVTSEMHQNYRYRFFPNGMCTVHHTCVNSNVLNTYQNGFVQADKLYYGTASRKLYEYIPRTLPIVGSLKTWDFKTPELISGTMEALQFSTAAWQDANNPPYRMSQILKTSTDVPVIGFTIGYSIQKGDSEPSIRKVAAAGSAMQLASSRKNYPYISSITPRVTNTFSEALCVRGYFDPVAAAPATVFQIYQEGATWIVFLDIHQTVTNQRFSLPPELIGKDITVLDTDGTITVQNSMVTSEGLVVSVTTYGMVTLKIS